MALWDLFSTTSFSPIEQQVVYLAANYENECHYCMAAHSGLAKMIGMSPEDIEALRMAPYFESPSCRLCITSLGGWCKPVDGLKTTIESFMAAGYGKQQVLEVILGIAVKVIHNYTNR